MNTQYTLPNGLVLERKASGSWILRNPATNFVRFLSEFEAQLVEAVRCSP